MAEYLVPGARSMNIPFCDPDGHNESASPGNGLGEISLGR